MTNSRFDGQTAIVTGGAAGIGLSVATRLAREGAKVALFDTDKQKLETSATQFLTKPIIKQVDISDEQATKKAIGAVVDKTDRLDVVVNCAGIVGPNGKPILEVDGKDFDKVYSVNLRGTFNITKHSLSFMQEKNYGRILLFASIAGKEGNAGMCAYSATKAGVIGLTKSVGKEYAKTNITVNAIAPAVIRTELVENMDPGQVNYMTERIPKQRCGTLDEVAALSCWIVSKEASFNTGFTFDLTGGRATY